jgi:hypothetical protein
MKTTTTEPTNAAYLGSENGDGTMHEKLADLIAEAIEPICYRDPEGGHHYFDASPN